MFNRRPRGRGTVRAMFAASVAMALTVVGGSCGRSTAPLPTARPVAQAHDERVTEELFESAVDTLFRLEDYSQLTRYSQPETRRALQERLNQWIEFRNPPIGWEPDPNEELLGQIIDRFSQWAPLHTADAEWTADPLIATLPEELAALPSMKALDELSFSAADGRFLQEAVWLRDASNMAVRDQVGDVDRAVVLFDWVVRNVQLEADESRAESGAIRLPWKTMLLGRGTARERAWVFILLARQQNLDVVMLATPDSEAEGQVRPWIPALLSDGELYLFDPWLGMPIPGADGAGVATLSEAAQDEAVLDRLDLSERRIYPVKASDLAEVTALIEASPWYLARRMKAVESQLGGDRRLVLSVEPSKLAERLRASQQIVDVRLWTLPQESMQSARTLNRAGREAAVAGLTPLMTPPSLWQGRMLQLKGHWEGEKSAVGYYQSARPSRAELENLPAELPARAVLATAKQYASYWLGLLSYERGADQAAETYLDRLTLQAWPDGLWTAGARYNLAQLYERTGRRDEAVELFSGDTSPQLHGNRLRGRWLAEQSDEAAAADAN